MLRSLKRAKYRKRDAAQPETREMPERDAAQTKKKKRNSCLKQRGTAP